MDLGPQCCNSGNGPLILYPGLAIAGNASSSSRKVYTYNSNGNGEQLDLNVTALSAQLLDVKLRGIKAAKDIYITTTN